MEKCKGFNVYIKEGKGFAVVTTSDGKVISINLGLIEYALKNPKHIDKKENK